MDDPNLDLQKRIIQITNFIAEAPADSELFDPVLIYFNGVKWNIVSIKTVMKYPLIYDIFTETNNDNINSNNIPITVCFCPFTFACAVYEGTYSIANFLYDGSLILRNDEKDTYLSIVTGITGKIINNKFTPISNLHGRRWETEIKLLRNAISDYPDCQYLIETSVNSDTTQTETTIIEPLVPYDYIYSDEVYYDYEINNDFHPKTLVIVIQYVSNQENKHKYSIIVGKDATSTKATGFNTTTSGLTDYIEKTEHELKEKASFIMPMFWFAAKTFHPTARIIIL